jgi:hypothetical protein
MRQIPLSQGKFTIVDDEDFEYLNQWKWYYRESVRGSNLGYAIRSTDKKRMHRIINKTPKGMYTDHINRNKLDNRKENLRTCTYSQNNCNKEIRSDNTSGFKGVIWLKRRSRWIVRLCKSGKCINGGSFKDKNEAAKRYNSLAIALFGKFAKLNQVDNPY